jgi:hypothetical protein
MVQTRVSVPALCLAHRFTLILILVPIQLLLSELMLLHGISMVAWQSGTMATLKLFGSLQAPSPPAVKEEVGNDCALLRYGNPTRSSASGDTVFFDICLYGQMSSNE